MKAVKTNALVPGLILAKDLYQTSGILLLNVGTVLTGDLIKKLEFFGFTEVMVEEPPVSLKEQEEELMKPQILATHEKVVGLTANLMSSGAPTEIDPKILKILVGDLDSQLDLNTNVFLSLSHLKHYDNYLFSHVVNVCILSLVIGRELKMEPDTLKDLGVSALLHDVGMIKVNPALYDHERSLAPGELTEVRRHPEYGFQMLLESGNYPQRVLSGVREHHERADRSGYPRGIGNEEAHEFGKIIAVADVYDACISPRKYRQRLTPYEAIKNLLGHSKLFDVKVLKAFVACMAIYPIGSFIRLNSGEIAKVVRINSGVPFRPEIAILTDRKGEKLEKPVRINLNNKEYAQTYIQETLERTETEKILGLLGEEGKM